MARRKRFGELSRPQQQRRLLRLLKRERRDIEKLLRDEAAYNDLQRARGGRTFPADRELLGLLQEIDQELCAVRDAP